MAKREKLKIVDEQQLMNELGIENWNQLSKDKFISYLKLIPSTDPEIIKLTIKELPKFADLAKSAIGSIKEVGNEALKGNKENLENFNKQFDIVLESLRECLKDGELTFDEKTYIINQMREILDLSSKKDKENKNFILHILYAIGVFLLTIFISLLTVIGIKVDAGKHDA